MSGRWEPRWDRFGWLLVANGVVLLLGLACALTAAGPVGPWIVLPVVVMYAGGQLVSTLAYWTGRKDGAR